MLLQDAEVATACRRSQVSGRPRQQNTHATVMLPGTPGVGSRTSSHGRPPVKHMQHTVRAPNSQRSQTKANSVAMMGLGRCIKRGDIAAPALQAATVARLCIACARVCMACAYGSNTDNVLYALVHAPWPKSIFSLRMARYHAGRARASEQAQENRGIGARTEGARVLPRRAISGTRKKQKEPGLGES